MKTVPEISLYYPTSTSDFPLSAVSTPPPVEPLEQCAPKRASKAAPSGPIATSYEQKCKYRTNKCWVVRAMKSNGKMHALCQYHREQANRHQRSFDNKLRQARLLSKRQTLAQDDQKAEQFLNKMKIKNRMKKDENPSLNFQYMTILKKENPSFEPLPHTTDVNAEACKLLNDVTGATDEVIATIAGSNDISQGVLC